jgi:hypothetical protein
MQDPSAHAIKSTTGAMNADLQKKIRKLKKCKRCGQEFKEINNNVQACQGRKLHISDEKLFKVVCSIL